MKKLLKKNVGANNHLPKTKSPGKHANKLWLLLTLPLFMKLFAACEKDKVDQDRIAELLLKGENVKSSDFKTAEKNLEDRDILHAVSDGKFHWTPKEYSASEIAWLVKKLKELESTGKGVIQGKNYINPRDFTLEDSTYLANLGFQVYRYGDDDPCELERDAVTTGAQDSCAWTWYTRERLDSALTKPLNVAPTYWHAFNYDGVLRETFRDSVDRHIEVIELWRDFYGDPIPLHRNGENMEVFYDACSTYVHEIIPDMESKRAALQECEDENSSIHFPQMKSATFQMQNREGILDGRRKMLKTVVSD
ncbi:MAG: hypothetical protein FWH18_12585 [Marinilabiliaceae bacterium]|nr:hypothetical protein [Marinilabiliaceae bacterium]